MYKQYKKDLKDGVILGPGGSDGRRQNCMGLPIVETRDRLSVQLGYKHSEMDYLCDRLDIQFDQLMQTEFLIMTYQIFCETGDGMVLPAEISLCRWSLVGKIHDLLTITMRPDSVPSGYASDVLNAEKIHAIPAFGTDSRKLNDYCYAWNAIKQFIHLQHSNPLYMNNIVFMMEASIDQGHRALHRLSSSSLNKANPFVIGVPDTRRSNIGIMSCESLYSVLWKQAPRHYAEPEPTTAEINLLLSTSVLAYDRGICCEYHETLENIHCSQNQLKHMCLGMNETLYRRFVFAPQEANDQQI